MKLSFIGQKMPKFLLMGNVGQNCAALWGWCLTGHPCKKNEHPWETEIPQKFPKSRHSMCLRAAADLALLSWCLKRHFPTAFSWYALFTFLGFSSGLQGPSSSASYSPVTLPPSPNLSLPCTSIASRVSITTFPLHYVLSGNKLVLSSQLDFKQFKGKGYVLCHS